MHVTPSSPSLPLRLDAHHHLWRYTPEEFGWLNDTMVSLRRDFLVPDLESALMSASVDAALTVQARCSVEETVWLLECASQTKRIAGVVGWLPLTEPELVEQIERFACDPKFVGAREIAQGEPEGFLDRTAFHAGIERFTEAGLVYELLIYEDQLVEATRLVDRHPKQSFVLDHAAKPPIAHGLIEPWRTQIRALAARPNIACKISGLTTEANRSDWTLDMLRPYLDVCVEAFGPRRLMCGSDWPVCLTTTSCARWWSTLADYFTTFTLGERSAVFGENVARIYGLFPTRACNETDSKN